MSIDFAPNPGEDQTLCSDLAPSFPLGKTTASMLPPVILSLAGREDLWLDIAGKSSEGLKERNPAT